MRIEHQDIFRPAKTPMRISLVQTLTLIMECFHWSAHKDVI